MLLRARLQRLLSLLLQVGVTVGALYYLFHDPAKRSRMAEALRHADWFWLAASVAAYGMVEVFAAVRWLVLLRIQRFDLAWGKATAILLIGEFFMAFTPGLIGADAMRLLYLVKEHPDKKIDAGLAVVMDRVLGMLALIALAAGVLATRYDWLSHTAAASRLVNVMLVLLAGGVALVAASVAFAKSDALATWNQVPEFVRETGEVFKLYAANWRLTLHACATPLVAHVFYDFSFCCAALALKRVSSPSPGFWDVFAVMPIVNTLTALPVSLAGIGLRESLFQVLLHDLAGTPEAVGVLIGVIGFVVRALWGLPGLAAFLFYRAPASAATVAPTREPAPW